MCYRKKVFLNVILYYYFLWMMLYTRPHDFITRQSQVVSRRLTCSSDLKQTDEDPLPCLLKSTRVQSCENTYRPFFFFSQNGHLTVVPQLMNVCTERPGLLLAIRLTHCNSRTDTHAGH